MTNEIMESLHTNQLRFYRPLGSITVEGEVTPRTSYSPLQINGLPVAHLTDQVVPPEYGGRVRLRIIAESLNPTTDVKPEDSGAES
jgi:hypothetical protein